MLVNFSVGNFRSIKNPTTLSMVAANITAKNKALDKENVFREGAMPLLKSAVIYGANASGKSNFLRAFTFMKRFVLRSTNTNSEDTIDITPFLLSTETENEPTYFEVVFLLENIRYRYGFEIDQNRVHTEWLYRTVKRESELFWREGDSIEVRSGFKGGKGLVEKTRHNALFLSVADQWNVAIAKQLIGWFKTVNVISGLEDGNYLGFTVDQLVEIKPVSHQITEFTKRMDLGISGISAEKKKTDVPFLSALQQTDELPEEMKKALTSGDWFTTVVKTIHNRYDESNKKVSQIEFDLGKHESEGTKKIFALSGPILHTLQNGQILFVDELDARLHPLMTRYIIELFNSTATNPNNAQLLFVTHDVNLLDNQLFRRDQIWFTEKDKYGATDMYSLVEYNMGVRNDASFKSDYVAGKYGAIPYIGNIKRLIGEDHE